MKRLTLNLLLASTLMIICGCSVYLDEFHYNPRPAVTEIPSTQPQLPPSLTAFASVIGVRVDDPSDHIPSSVEVRLRLQNNGPRTVTFDPQTMELLNGSVMRFGPPILDAEPPVTLAPYQSAAIDTEFPFPAGSDYDNTDLDTLQLRWQVKVNGQAQFMSADFHRAFYPYYYEPYSYGYPGYVGFGWFGPGVVVVHRR